MFALEIHDGGLLAATGDGAPDDAFEESPGFALLDGETLYTGRQAYARARRMPRAVHNRFWRDLGLDPAGRPFPESWSVADLAHAHLEDLWRQQPLPASPAVLTLPPTFSRDQLSILLGIFQAVRRPVAALVDSAVAAVRASGLTGPVLFLDPQLHRFTLTAVILDGDVQGLSTEVLEGAGLEDLHELWARHISAVLVRATRFDPLHSGAAEQRLYDRLPEWLAQALEGEGFEARFEQPGGEFRARIRQAPLLEAVAETYGAVRDRAAAMIRNLGPAALLLSHRAARLPGLAPRLMDLGRRDLRVSPRGAAARSALEAAQCLGASSEGLTFLHRLPLPPAGSRPEAFAAGPEEGAPKSAGREALPAAAGPDPGPASGPPAATHVVHQGLAYPLGPGPFHLGSDLPEGQRGLRLRPPDGAGALPRCTLLRDGAKAWIEAEDGASAGGTWRLNGASWRGDAPLVAGDRLCFEAAAPAPGPPYFPSPRRGHAPSPPVPRAAGDSASHLQLLFIAAVEDDGPA